MGEYISALIIFSLLGYIVFLNKQHQKETSALLDRIMAKNLQEFQEHTQPVLKENPATTVPDLVPMNELSDAEWDKLIKEQAGTETVKQKAVKKLKSLARK